MVAWVTLSSICAFAVSFYLRFVVALLREYRHLRRGFAARIEPATKETFMIEIGHEEDQSSVPLHGQLKVS